MRFVETPLSGVIVIEPERHADERGWFARTFDREEFAARGMNDQVIQTNASFNARAGTLRGMHHQAEPHGETKVVRCVRGAIFDVALDLRPGSPTNGRWHGVELSEENGRGFYIPAGLAHGFQTLREDSEVHYLMGSPYVAGAARGVRWDDPAFGIEWPQPPAGGRVISERDASYPDHGP
jgi:dTDP-4-dehydrorhamnose 3,5-epimerase